MKEPKIEIKYQLPEINSKLNKNKLKIIKILKKQKIIVMNGKKMIINQ